MGKGTIIFSVVFFDVIENLFSIDSFLVLTFPRIDGIADTFDSTLGYGLTETEIRLPIMRA
jgi:hypothetical protein